MSGNKDKGKPQRRDKGNAQKSQKSERTDHKSPSFSGISELSSAAQAAGTLTSTALVQGVNSNSNKQRSQGQGQSPGQEGNAQTQASISIAASERDKTSNPTYLNIVDLPFTILENLFTFLNLSDLPTASTICRKFADIIYDEDNEVWRSNLIRELKYEITHSELLNTLSYKAKLRAYHHAWNPHDCSRNIFVKENGFTIHRNPVAQSTDGVRGKRGFSEGRHSWEVTWEGPLGTVAVVGVASRRADLRAQGYIALLGQDEHSWGWNLVDNSLLHNGDSQRHYQLLNNAPRYQIGERIRVILNCDDKTLAFEKDYEFLGVAFQGLPSNELLYPAISAVYGNTEVSMIYLGPSLDADGYRV